MAIRRRKREFSEAFTGSPNRGVHRVAEETEAALCPITTPLSPAWDADVEFSDCDKENVDPATISKFTTAAQFPELEADFEIFTSYTAYAMDVNADSLPGESDQMEIESGFEVDRIAPLPDSHYWSQSSTETNVQDHQFFDSASGSSTTNLSSSPNQGPVLATCLESDFPILQDLQELNQTVLDLPGHFTLPDTITPSSLNFQDLALETSQWPQMPAPVNEGSQMPAQVNEWPQSPGLVNEWPQIPAPVNEWPEGNHTSYFVLNSNDSEALFPIMLPSEVILSFSNGKKFVKMSRSALSSASTFFASLLSTPYAPSTTQCLRLRDDFPWAITALVEYIATGSYKFHTSMLTAHPNMTIADLHMHAYLAGRKYVVPRLCTHAMREYLECAESALLHMDVIRGDPYGPNYAESLLHSLLLLWRNTPVLYPMSAPYARDALRFAALDCIVKPRLNAWLKVPFFATMMRDVPGFSQDLSASLEEDGLKVGVVGLPAGVGDRVGNRWGVRFAGKE